MSAIPTLPPTDDETSYLERDFAIEVIELGDENLLIRANPYVTDLLTRAARLDGFDDVGRWIIHALTAHAGETAAYLNGDQALGYRLLEVWRNATAA